MKKTILLFLLIANVCGVYAQEDPPKMQKDTAAKMDAFTWVQQMPKFPGGDAALHKFIADNTKYPKEARQKEIQGRMIVRFVVDEGGNIKDAHIPTGTSLGGGCDEEAVRVVNSMPKWEPGKQNGHAVAVWCTVNVEFRR